MAKELFDVAGETRAETELAYLFFDGDQEVWLPKSQCQWDPDDRTMTMPVWLAQEKGLI